MNEPAISDEPMIRPFAIASQGSAPKRAEHNGLGQVDRERARRFGGEKRALDQAVGEKDRRGDRPGGDHDAGEIADHEPMSGEMPEPA